MITVFKNHKEFQVYFRRKLLAPIYATEELPAYIHNVMRDESLYIYWLYKKKQHVTNSIYDYIYFLRKERAKVLPLCKYKVKRRKTPQYQHGFSSDPRGFIFRVFKSRWEIKDLLKEYE